MKDPKGLRSRCLHSAAQHIAAGTGVVEVDDTLLKMRVSVISCPKQYASDHGPPPFMLFALRHSGMANPSVNGTIIGTTAMSLNGPIFGHRVPLVFIFPSHHLP